MNAITKKIAIALLALGALLVPASQASAAEAPAWRFDITSIPTNFEPGATFLAQAPPPVPPAGDQRRHGADQRADHDHRHAAGGTDAGEYRGPANGASGTCSNAGATVTCVFPGPVRPGEIHQPGDRLRRRRHRHDPARGRHGHQPGDPLGRWHDRGRRRKHDEVSATIAPFDFLPGIPGFGMTPYAEDGTAETLAGGHPHVLSVNLSFSTQSRSDSTIRPASTAASATSTPTCRTG